MKKLFLAIAMLFVLCAPAWAQSEIVDDQISPEINAQQIFQQTKPLTVYSSKASDNRFLFGNSPDGVWVIIPNMQISVSNNEPINAFIFANFNFAGLTGGFFVDNKPDLIMAGGSAGGVSSYSHFVRLNPGSHLIELRIFLQNGAGLEFSTREITVLTF